MGTVRIKRSSTQGSVPSGLLSGELALNTIDRKLYAIDNGNVVKFINFTSDSEKVVAGPIADALANKANIGVLPTVLNFNQPSIIMKGIADRIQIERTNAKTTNFADMFFVRDLRGNNQTGTKGDVSSSIRIQTNTENNDSYQWGLVSVLDNYGVGQGQHCAGYFQANRRSGTSGMWALALEARDFTGDPTYPTIALEAGLFASGPDSNKNRIGIDLVIGEANPGVNTYNGVSTGLRIGAQNEAGIANVEITSGIEVKNKVFNGIDLSGIDINYSNRAVVMGLGQKLVWNNGLEITTTGSNLALNMPTNGVVPGDGSAYIAFIRANIGGIGNCCIPIVAYR